MCGIAGIIERKSDVKFDDLHRMTQIIDHRGPDSEGHFVDGKLGLGHRRLAIIDLSSAGHQPMIDDELVIVFNGEIYNYREIKVELQKKGFLFKTESDTEVIIQAYKCWGEDCISKFNGMWSLAIYDKNKKKIFMSRDRFGIKPFYYYQTKDTFYFGSEIKQLLLFIPEKKVNKSSLYDFIYLSYKDHNEKTFFQDIYSLLPGHNLVYDLKTNKVQRQKYYELVVKKPIAKQSLDNSIKQFQEKFNHSIKLRLRSDVRVGTCLSGGLDSSFVVKVAASQYSGDVKLNVITAKSIDPANDESDYAKIVSDWCNLDLDVVMPNKDDFYTLLDDIIYIQEEPFSTPSIFMQYYVMKAAKEKGCIVMLDGQGGDETLLGYERYFVPFLKSIKNPFAYLKEFYKLSKNSKLSFLKLILYYLYFGNKKIRIKKVLYQHNYVQKNNQKHLNKELVGMFATVSKNIFNLQQKEISSLQLPSLLKYEDRNSMAHSIEARVPFLDHELVELAMSIPLEHKICNGWSKYVLRKSFGSKFPNKIVWRKRKLGFEAPTKKWMKNKTLFIKTIEDSLFLKSVVKPDYSFSKLDDNTLWKLYSIAKWASVFNVKY